MQMTDRTRSAHGHPSARLSNIALALFFSTALGCGADAEPDDVAAADAGPAVDVRPETESVEDAPPSAISSVPSDEAPGLQPREPVEPPNPATHRPPMYNPGGLDRFRPARRSSGLP